jgi:hypothetical protein
MKEEKVKVNLRVGLLIRETLVDEAAVEDIRVGTLANRLLQSEMDKVMKVGADNCLIMNSREYLASKAEIEQNRAAYYLFPETKVVSRFIATQLDDKILFERADGCAGKAGTKAADTANDPKRCGALLSVCYRRYAAESSALPCAGSIRQ